MSMSMSVVTGNGLLLTGETEEVDWKQHDRQNDHSVGRRSQICRGMLWIRWYFTHVAVNVVCCCYVLCL